MNKEECCVLIPSLSPDERLEKYTDSLLEAGFGCVLVVDDGSAAEYQPIFDRLAQKERCRVLHHDVNHGKGRALKTGFAWIRDETDFRGVVTADSDGQHTVEDALNLCGLIDGQREEMILGSRDFSKNSVQVPPKSRAGNRITSAVFRLLYGPSLPDTQTGLRAFRRDMIPMMLEVEGDRFEYEMNQLIVCAAKKIPMTPVPIHTIYHDENKGTHFHPIRDSWRIYKLILGNFFRYSASSIICFLIDYAVLSLMMFWVFRDRPDVTLLGIPFSFKALVAAPIARLCSAPVNYLLNRDFVFRAGKDRTCVKRYIVLCVCSLTATTLIFGFLDHFVDAAFLHILLKIVIDVAMYFVNYRFQQGWVFGDRKAPADGND